MNNTLKHAQHYASLGIPVFPLHYISNDGVCSCGDKAVNANCKPGKHPYGKLAPNGVKNATTNRSIITKWFAAGPYNIGIPTGSVSGIFALDRDDRDGGHETLTKWETENGKLPNTLTQTTGGGQHYIFKLPIGVVIRNSQKKVVAPGIDVRGEGGYICAPPSKHECGKLYSWDQSEFFDPNLVVDAPRWLIQKLTSSEHEPPKQQNNSIASGVGFHIPETIGDGEGRESFLIKYAAHLRFRGLEQSLIEQILLDFNASRVSPPLDDSIVLDRARRYEGHTGEKQHLAEAANSIDWVELEPLDDPLPKVTPIPVLLLPHSISAYVVDVATRMTCPVEFPAIGGMLALASVIGSKISCRPYRDNPWMVPAGAWGMLVSQPSQLKTPPLAEMLRPLKALDRAAAAKFDKENSQYQIDRALYDKAVKDAIKQNSNVVGMEPPAEPKMRRFLVNDSTYEMLVAIARANPNGFLVFRDELQGWFHSLNKENQKEARGLYLTGWSGTEDYATDRIGRGHVRADRVNISLIGTIQPNVIRCIVYDAVSGGVGDDGLVARFQLAVYPDPITEFKYRGGRANIEAAEQYEALISQLAELDPKNVGCHFTLDGQAYLHFCDDAQLLFDSWRESLENRIRNPKSDEHPVMLAHLGKYRSLVPKLALIIHLSEGGVGDISTTAVKKAIGWVKVLEGHARRIYHTATNRTMQSALALAAKIENGALKTGFTSSHILTKEWSGLRTAEEVNTALTVLEDRGWLISMCDRNTGGRPSVRYYINPKVRKAA